MLELAARSGEGRFRAAAGAAIAYERTLFSAGAGNWLDVREREAPDPPASGPAPCMTAWCHGAPGIGLARLRSLPHLDDATIRGEIGTALATTVAEGFGRNHTLCHGDLGNLDFVVQAAEALGDPRWRPRGGPPGRPDPRGDRPGGVALRGPAGGGVARPDDRAGGDRLWPAALAEPTRLPSVLVLEPPMLSV